MLIRRNPITMVGTITKCWLLTWRVPADDVAPHLPAPLELVTRDGSAFWNMVVCEIHHMRPRGLPRALGMSYRHVAYRLYARLPQSARNGNGAVEGLYFVRSDCNSRLITAAGRTMTDFNFHQARIRIDDAPNVARVNVHARDAHAHILINRETQPTLPPDSCFISLDEASAFLKYKPAGLSVQPGGRVNVVHISRDESAWKCRLVHLERAEVDFFADGRHGRVRPEICYDVAPISYQWNRAQLIDANRANR